MGGGCLTIFSDVRRFHSLACTCRKLHLFKKKGIRTAKDHNRPSGLYSCTDQKEVLTFYLRSNSQWITVAVLRKRLRSAAKQGQQKDTL